MYGPLSLFLSIYSYVNDIVPIMDTGIKNTGYQLCDMVISQLPSGHYPELDVTPQIH